MKEWGFCYSSPSADTFKRKESWRFPYMICSRCRLFNKVMRRQKETKFRQNSPENQMHCTAFHRICVAYSTMRQASSFCLRLTSYRLKLWNELFPLLKKGCEQVWLEFSLYCSWIHRLWMHRINCPRLFLCHRSIVLSPMISINTCVKSKITTTSEKRVFILWTIVLIHHLT